MVCSCIVSNSIKPNFHYFSLTQRVGLYLTGGSGTFAVGGGAEVGATVMLTEGTNFIMNLTNTSASAEDISVRFLWHETK